VPWARLLREPGVLAVVFAHFCHNYFNYICLSSPGLLACPGQH
jgi:hypothetical protein